MNRGWGDQKECLFYFPGWTLVKWCLYWRSKRRVLENGDVLELIREEENQGEGGYAKVGGVKTSTMSLESRGCDRGDRWDWELLMGVLVTHRGGLDIGGKNTRQQGRVPRFCWPPVTSLESGEESWYWWFPVNREAETKQLNKHRTGSAGKQIYQIVFWNLVNPLLMVFLWRQMTFTDENLEMPLSFMETWTFNLSTWSIVLVIYSSLTCSSKM